MERYEAIVVGAGPGGATCAKALAEAGKKVLLVDREAFPRDKLCAGWITPDVVSRVGLTRDNYPHRFLTFDELQFHFPFWPKPYRSHGTQHSIRRIEFDNHLVELATAAGVEVATHNVRKIHSEGDGFRIDDLAEAQYLIGAGGTRCPVHRNQFADQSVRSDIKQVAALEYEFPYDYEDQRCHLWFYADGLPGYAWYVPKENGYLNCGLGGLAHLIRKGLGIKDYWDRFVDTMVTKGLLSPDVEMKPKGYSYYLRNQDVIRKGNAFLVGDAAGLATLDLGEGIGAAVQSGELAAEAIVAGSAYELRDVRKHTSPSMVGASIALGMRNSFRMPGALKPVS